MDLRADSDPQTGDVVVSGRLAFADLAAAMNPSDKRKRVQELADAVQGAVIGHVAEKFLEAHLQEVLAAINPQAVATLALAQIAARVVDRLQPPAEQR